MVLWIIYRFDIGKKGSEVDSKEIDFRQANKYRYREWGDARPVDKCIFFKKQDTLEIFEYWYIDTWTTSSPFKKVQDSSCGDGSMIL